MPARIVFFTFISCFLIGCGGGGANNVEPESQGSSQSISNIDEPMERSIEDESIQPTVPELSTSELVASSELTFNSDYYLELTVEAPAGNTVLVYQYAGSTPTTEQRLFMATTDGNELIANLRLGPQLNQLLLQLMSSDPETEPRELVLDLPLTEYHWQP